MVDPAPPQRRDSYESMKARVSARYARHMALAAVFMRLAPCYMALCSPKDLTTALCQACGEALELGYFGHFGVIWPNFQRPPTAAMASAHGALGLLNWLRGLIDTTKALACCYNAVSSHHTPRHEEHGRPRTATT